MNRSHMKFAAVAALLIVSNSALAGGVPKGAGGGALGVAVGPTSSVGAGTAAGTAGTGISGVAGASGTSVSGGPEGVGADTAGAASGAVDTSTSAGGGAESTKNGSLSTTTDANTHASKSGASAGAKPSAGDGVSR